MPTSNSTTPYPTTLPPSYTTVAIFLTPKDGLVDLPYLV